MRLTELIQAYKGSPDPEILGLTVDSRQVQDGYLFAALPGSRYNGADYIDDAVRHGAAAILVPQDTELSHAGVASIVSDNPRKTLAHMAAAFYQLQPQTLAAVTGTNGKTSVVHFTQQLWAMSGKSAASLGTLGVRGPGMIREGKLTTPDPVSLHAELADLAAAGITHLAMEASSHGLHQNRLDGVRASVVGFTNLTHDHLDYHGSMEQYFAAKSHLFSDILVDGGTAVINADIPEFSSLKDTVEKRGCRVISYGRSGEAIKIVALQPEPKGQRVELDVGGTVYTVNVPLVGEFQVMNVLCALGMVMADDTVDVTDIVGGLDKLVGAPGRLQYVPGSNEAAVYVDYAHTPDALDHVLRALRPHTAGRLFSVVGCGGDRDPHKRPLMGEIASSLSDVAVITDDNPRTEDPAAIRQQMMKGAGSSAKEIGDRRKAIKWAINELKDGDVLVVAGKGHEQGQIIGEIVEPFDDVQEVQSALKAKEGSAL